MKKLKFTIIASFQAKIGLKMPIKRKIKIIGPFRSYTTRNRKFQKIVKIFEKLKNIFMASCLAKIGLKRPRRRENNIYRSVPFLPDAK